MRNYHTYICTLSALNVKGHVELSTLTRQYTYNVRCKVYYRVSCIKCEVYYRVGVFFLGGAEANKAKR